MEATLLDFDFEARLRAFHQERSKDRSPGRHLSDILHYIGVTREPARYGGDPDLLLMHGGFIWEDVASLAFQQQIGGKPKQMELLVDGIYMTLDGFSARRWRVLEFKNTKISAVNPIRSRRFMLWHMQMMAYARAMDAMEAELYVLFSNGSYELGGGRFGKPVGKAWVFRFSKLELEENWQMILSANGEMEGAA